MGDTKKPQLWTAAFRLTFGLDPSRLTPLRMTRRVSVQEHAAATAL